MNAEQLWGRAEADVIKNGMTPEQATDKAFKRKAEGSLAADEAREAGNALDAYRRLLLTQPVRTRNTVKLTTRRRKAR